MNSICISFLSLSLFVSASYGYTSYANDFIDPEFVLARQYVNNTMGAQATIKDWADELAAQGSWSVTSKPFNAPSGDKHDYMSWAPYWWPDCSKVGNTTVLPPEEVWKRCPYKSRDGQFNPDVRLVNNVGAFQNFSDAVLYNSLAWVLVVVKFIKTWFLDEDTRMNPNLNYAQMQRGPDGQTGSHTGVLDLKSMSKVVSGILLLREGKSSAWTPDIDAQMVAWSKEYITWLETAHIAIEEAHAENNHGTFYYNQLAALKILVNDMNGAKNVTDAYFKQQYLSQINANGEQPLEAARTRPYHYRAYNLAAMITNARLSQYATKNSDVWRAQTSSGATIRNALDFAMTISAKASNEDSYAEELYPNIGAVAAVYGDPNGKYLTYLQKAEPTFTSEAWYFWNQPFALSLSGGNPTPSPAVNGNQNAQSNTNSGNLAYTSLIRGFGGWTIFILTVIFHSFAI
ncbi:hypothetical protein AMATHDRAFT_143319 [Amanita thiersii Skay4041]|uniref:Alginate lyase domain-containing protein n=1 Tax=Amanita thiersii Skay4041 TaxID=703135 RepID=A0A2A9NS95_9AGAR|nr:hypothetical protein AMATHDRAFT_143319 [Amanita thiersii Skay4041]